ncbi:hypothetical protein [Hyphomicrobium sp.]|uniref:hypothetical protein n=1 Tax=Hyphomicrobium sp. TaxID=82 RepID=UPI001D80AC53|nr:hypothetical protein [Hyphomicrobium sp.]MBY0560049.1 hypothetical protein [Hyphomicrobium sp.]
MNDTTNDSGEVNFAEREARIRDNPSMDDCYATGRSHFGYGWACTPWGHWSDEQKEAYRAGYQAAKQKG